VKETVKKAAAPMMLALLILSSIWAVGPASAQPMPEKHPQIHKAEKFLHDAKHALENAAHDFGGHRVKAIEAIDRALEELRMALEFDKK